MKLNLDDISKVRIVNKDNKVIMEIDWQAISLLTMADKTKKLVIKTKK